MKKPLWKRLVSSVITGALFVSMVPISAIAADTDAGTVAGEAETVKVSSITASSRETNFNSDWKFYLGTSSTAQNKNFDDSGWKNVTLPHDFSISQSYTTSGEAESGFLPGGTGWYRKTFTLPAADAGKSIILNFDGVYSDAYVYVNGTSVGENHYGYNSFAFDISDYVTCDGSTENVIAVKAVNNIPSSRWYSGSGIYRDVTLMVTDPIHVSLHGTCVTTPNIQTGDGTVQTAVEVSNDSSTSASVTVSNTVYDSKGEAVSQPASDTASIAAGGTATVTTTPVVSNPKLWDVDSPTLYYVRTEIAVDGTVVDTCDTEFGFRWYSFDSDNGFYLNGKAVKLNGVCMHHDQGALGSAAAYDAMYRQLASMKEMGANAIRTSHNPADEDFIDICNELGLMVIEEAFDGWSVSKNGNSNDFGKYFNTSLSSSNQILGGDSSMTWAEFAIKSMVRRDRNDPSVILWSLGNEIQEGASADSSFPTIAQNLIDWVEEVDTTRPTTIGSNQRTTSGTLGSVHSVIADNGGIVGFNYASSSNLSSMHSTYGKILSAETSSAVNSRGIYSSQANASNVDGKYHLTSYDTSKVSWGMTAHDSIWNTMTKDYVAGEFVWTGWDYLGEPTPWNGTGSGDSGRGCIPNSSYFGIVDTAGFEKDTYYLYRSQWKQDDTTLHLVTAWDSDNMLTSSSKTPVVIYSNAPTVELYRNGTLIGTATRTVCRTDAGHIYYTYTTTSNDSSVCTAVSASGSSSLYATFNVAYEEGTISAKAYDENGTEITETSGNASVSTPDTVSKLKVETNKTEIQADGSSLAYISVDVTDAEGNLDTTAANTINFSLSGNGEIVGVDNGDQATTAKYQQSSVLTSTTSANIAAYAGKALVIVRSTKEAGRFTVTASSSNLTGGSVSVATTAVSEETEEGLVSYTMVRDYTVKAGTQPALQTEATGTLADGSTVEGTITWENIAADTYNTAGDYTIKGTLQFSGLEDIAVTAKLHVIANVVAMRNVSTVTMTGSLPTLPNTVNGVLADGTLSGEFAVTWDTISADQFAAEGDIVTVNGTVTVFGQQTLPVTCTVRVAKAVNTESTNVASAASLTEDCASTSDNLSSIVDGVTNNSSDTNARWTNYNNRNTSDTASITFTWATAQLISSVNLYYFTDNHSASLPAEVAFAYSLNGTDFTNIGYQDVTPTAGFTKTAYVFDEVINPVALRITFTGQSGHCVGLTEAEIMTYAGKVEVNTSADLSGIAVDGTAISGFDADTLTYTASGSQAAATTAVNAGITVLPADDSGVVRILTVSEDGSAQKTYVVTLKQVQTCEHENTELRNAKEATCTEAGYTGDTVCTDCGETVKEGTVIPTTNHTTEVRNAKEATCTETGYTGDEICTVCGETVKEGTVIPTTNHTTEVRNAKEATCTETGYTGDKVCTVCGEVVEEGSEIPVKDHSWDDGVVTKEPTETEEGVKTYTCKLCGETKTEAIPVVINKIVPTASVSAERAARGTKITLIGKFNEYGNENCYKVTSHGLVYLSSAKLGTRNLTVNTAGRTRVTFTGYKEDGSFRYTFTPASKYTTYTVRTFLTYVNDEGRTIYVYSNPIRVSYNGL